MTRRCPAFLILVSLLAACVSRSPSSQTSQSTPEGLELLHKLQNAVGGAERIAAVRDFDETVRAEAWDSRGTPLGEVRKRTRWMRTPNVLRLDQIGPRGTYVLYFDGGATSGWEIMPDLTGQDPYKTTGRPMALAGGELEFANGYLSGFDLDLWLADRTPGSRVTSPRPHVVRIEHDGKATDFTLDPIASLPLASAGLSLADPNRPVPNEMRYESWSEVSGVRFATHRTNYLSGRKRGEVTAADIRVNVGLQKQDLARQPVNFAPEVSRP